MSKYHSSELKKNIYNEQFALKLLIEYYIFMNKVKIDDLCSVLTLIL